MQHKSNTIKQNLQNINTPHTTNPHNSYICGQSSNKTKKKCLWLL